MCRERIFSQSWHTSILPYTNRSFFPLVILTCCLLLCLNPVLSVAGDAENWLAIVGEDTISVEQYKFRFETVPHTGFDQTARQDFLDALIIEYLLADNTDSLSERYQLYFAQLEAEARIETYLMEEIESSISVSDDLIRTHFIYALRSLTVDACAAVDSATATAIMERVAMGEAFRTAVNAYPSTAELIEGLTVKWNTTDPVLEEVLFNLEPGEVSDPVFAGDYWWVLYLAQYEQTRIPSEQAYRELAPWIRDALEAREARNEQNHILMEAMQGHSMAIDPEGWKWLVEELYAHTSDPVDPRLEIPFTMFPETAAEQIGDVSAETFVEIEGPVLAAIWSRQEIVNRLRMAPIPLPGDADPEQFEHNLHAHIRWLVEFAVLDQIALKEGYQQNPRMKRDAILWQRHLQARYELNKFLDSSLSTESAQSDVDRQLMSLVEARAEAVGVQVNHELLYNLDLVEVPVMIRKRHFPNRPATPMPVGYPWASLTDF